MTENIKQIEKYINELKFDVKTTQGLKEIIALVILETSGKTITFKEPLVLTQGAIYQHRSLYYIYNGAWGELRMTNLATGTIYISANQTGEYYSNIGFTLVAANFTEFLEKKQKGILK